MFLILCFLFRFGVGCCTEELQFEIKTVTAGQNVTLRCPRQTSPLYKEAFYWIRLVSGNWPEFLGATLNFMDVDVSKIPHIQTRRDGGEFLLHINKAKRNDTGLYYCIKVKQLNFIFMNGTFLKIKGPGSDISAIIQEPSSGPLHPKTHETLQCSVLSDSEESTCLTDNRVYWFRAGPDNSHPSLLYLQRHNGTECERSSDAPTAKKCFYNFSETFDAGTYHCAVAACGQILFGNGIKLHEATNISSQQINIFIGFTLANSLIVLAVLIYSIKESNFKASEDPQVKGMLCKNRQANVYTTVIFTVMNVNGVKKKAYTETKIYAALTGVAKECCSNPL